jgi:hypothetical protein
VIPGQDDSGAALFGFESANFAFASYLIPPLRVIPRVNVSASVINTITTDASMYSLLLKRSYTGHTLILGHHDSLPGIHVRQFVDLTAWPANLHGVGFRQLT